MAILVLGPIPMIVANRVVDGAQAVYDINGNAHVIGGGGPATRLSGVVAMGAAIVVSVLVIARGVVQRRGAVTLVALIGLLTVVGTVVRREDTASLLDVLAAADGDRRGLRASHLGDDRRRRALHDGRLVLPFLHLRDEPGWRAHPRRDDARGSSAA